ncbi:MAG: urease accessory protein UreD [Trueperaceae bacterium]|nr:urease accessory protein UreD [Trueperaceae bacterium]
MTRLELLFKAREGKTVLAEQFGQGALKVLRPFELESGRVLLQILNVGPGIMAGDLYKLYIKLASGAKVVIVNQSASKLHSMPEGRSACQVIHIELESGAELEYYPGLSIPFKDTQFKNRVAVDLATGAKFALLESWAMGRIAFHERFLFRKLSSQIKVRQTGKLLYADALELDADSARLGLSDAHSYLATGLWVWDRLPETTKPEPIRAIRKEENVFVSEAFEPDKLYLRALANDSLWLSQTTQRFINTWRLQIGFSELEFDRYRS